MRKNLRVTRLKFRQFLTSLGVAALLTACSHGSPVSEAVNARLPNATSIDVAALTPFAWETMYVFSPYTPRRDICSKLATAWKSCEDDLPESIDEDNYLLAFVGSGRLVHHERFRRHSGEFCAGSCVLVIPQNRAVFSVRPARPGQKAPRYTLVPIAA